MIDMNLTIDGEFRKICSEIALEDRAIDEWSQIESDDMFQSRHYEGGFDADEREFCFSYFSSDGVEYWFQVSLEQVKEIAAGSVNSLEVSKADR